jgi:hypothetical protein
MSAFHLIPIFLERVSDHWASLLTGGLLMLCITLIERRRGKSMPWRSFLVITLVAFCFSCFLAWRDEYLKTTGSITLSMRWPNPEKTNQAVINVHLFIDNSTEKGVVFNEIVLARINVRHSFYNKLYSIAESCLNKVPSPHINEIGNIPQPLRTAEGLEVTYLDKIHVSVDGIPSESGIVSLSGKETKYIEAAFRGKLVERGDFNISSLCIIINFFETAKGSRIIVCDGTESGTPSDKDSAVFWGASMQRVEIFPDVDNHCRDLGF